MFASFCVQQSFAEYDCHSSLCPTPFLPSPEHTNCRNRYLLKKKDVAIFVCALLKALLQVFSKCWFLWLLRKETQVILLHGQVDWIKKKLTSLSETTKEESDEGRESLIFYPLLWQFTLTGQSSIYNLKIVMQSEMFQRHALCSDMKE